MKHTRIHTLLKRFHLLKIARKSLELTFDITRPIKYKCLDVYSYTELCVLRTRAKVRLKKWIQEEYTGITDTQRDIPLIVSLTSYPARLHAVHLSIMSIMRQSIKADKIILWLKKEEFVNTNNIPEILKKLQSCGLTIKWIVENTRSFAKLIPSKKLYPNANIVTADDDIIYASHWLETLYTAHLQHPEVIMGLNGLILVKKDAHTLESFYNIY